MDRVNPHWRAMSVLVVGLGKSGEAAAQALRGLGADVLVTDHKDSDELCRRAEKLDGLGVRVVLGRQDEADLEGCDLVVASPGVANVSDLLSVAKGRGVVVWSEVEVAGRLAKGPIVGVTGTNGKTTTTKLIGRILEAAGRRAVTCGNIGPPLVSAAMDAEEGTVLVAELSSFQLSNIDRFRANVAVLLNITQDHFDWHPDFEDYVASKARIFENQTAEDCAIINMDEPVSAGLTGKVKGKLLGFSHGPLAGGVFVAEGQVVVSDGGKTAPLVSVAELPIMGDHNIENSMAAAGAAFFLGASREAISVGLTGYEGGPNRIEDCGTVAGVRFVNDSKATNPDAVVKALTAFSEPVILLMGGRNKGLSFAPISRALRSPRATAKLVVAFGEAKDEVKRDLKDCGLAVIEAPRLAEAVQAAFKQACPGEVVLLSPACASFDEFSGHEERGERFKDVVAGLEDSHGAGGGERDLESG